jgi:hypothetical protein
VVAEYEKTHRPERELDQRSSHREARQPSEATGVSAQEARMWRDLGAQRAPATAGDAAQSAIDGKGAGQPVDPGLAAAVGAQTGANVADARVHSDPLSQRSTRAMGARAFAHGNDVFLGPGERADDQTLMAHELTHVAQQRGGTTTPQRKAAVGDSHSAAEVEADHVAKQVTAGAPPQEWVVDAGPLAPGQMLKDDFFAALRPIVTRVADLELGRLGSALACPYIAEYFAKYGGQPATATSALVNKWIPSARNAASAAALIPLIADRVRAGVHTWKESGKLPPDLAAAEPAAAREAQAQAPTAQMKSLEGMEHELGAGQAVDSKLAAPLGAEGARVHTGPAAAAAAEQHDAVAFAVGQNVVMGANAPKQGTLAGDALLAHELAHTAQQKDAASDPSARKKPIADEDKAAEHDADRAALATLGNFAGKVGDVMRTGLQLQRCASKDPGLNRFEYAKQHEAAIAADAASTIRKLPFGTMDSSIAWANGGQMTFAGLLGDQIVAQAMGEGLEPLVKPERLTSLIDPARVMDEDAQTGGQGTNGPRQYTSAVGVEVANALARRTTESLQRELPRYAQAKLHGAGEPKADDLAVSHPIDPLVARALTTAPLVTIDGPKFEAAHADLAGPPRALNKTRNIVLEPVGETGMWFRLQEPADATLEEIATAKLGKPTEAYRITKAGNLYGIAKDPGQEFYGDPASLDPTAQLLGREPGLQDEAILAQAGTAKPTRSGARILEQMRINATAIGKTVFEQASKFGPDVAAKLGDAAARLDARIARLATANEADIQKWDNQVSTQADRIAKGGQGLTADLLRLQQYASMFEDNLQQDPGAHKLSAEYRTALHTDAQMWVDAIAVSDMVGSSQTALVAAARHSATLETEILERQLNMAQKATLAAADSDQTKADFDVSTMPQRELEARQQLAIVRAQTISDPLAIDSKQKVQANEQARDLTFEAQVIANAANLDTAWKLLDDMDGTLSHLTGDHGDLSKLKAEGKSYYNEWVGVQKLIKAKDKVGARKAFETLAAKPSFQDFLARVQNLVKDVQKHHLIATIIATVVITVVTMGAGIVVEGLVGGGAIAAEAAAGAEVTADVAAAARTARIAGMVANAATGALLNQIVFAKSLTVKGFLVDFGRNLILFGAFKAVSAGFKLAGLDKVVQAGFKDGATAAQTVKAGGVVLGEAVLNGGVGALEALIEAKLEEAGGGKPLTQDEAEKIVLHNVVQMVGMAMFTRFASSPLETLRVKSAYQGQAWRHAIAERNMNRSAMEALRSGDHTSEEIVARAKQEQTLIQDEIAALEELKKAAAADPKALEGTGFTPDNLDGQITKLGAYGAKTRGFEFAFSVQEIEPGLYKAPRAQIPEMMRAQAGVLAKPPEVESRSPETGARTWVLQPKDEAPYRVVEEMPEWAISEPGKKLVQAAERANLDWVFQAKQPEIEAMLAYERAVATNDPKAAEQAEKGLAKLPKDHAEALKNALQGLSAWRSAETQRSEAETLKAGGQLDPTQRAHVADELRRQVPDIGLVDAVHAGEAKTVLSVVVPGGGETGIKAMNDEMIGYGLNSSQLIPERNAIIKRAFEAQGFKVIDQGYKMTTLVTDLPAEQTGAKIQAALGEVDAKMKPLLVRVLGDGITHFTAEKAKLSPKDPNRALYDKRIKKMTALRDKIAAEGHFHFDFQLGAADIKGGKDAGYAEILGAEMDASKAAIMARDAGVKTGRTDGSDGRAIVYSQADFLAFCKETVALKDGLASATLPYEGRSVHVFDAAGNINHDLLRAIRKEAYKEQLSEPQKQTLAKLKQYITRVNSFDYVKHFTGDEVGDQGAEVAETSRLVKELEQGGPISKADAERIDEILSGGIPQAGAASEAQFYAKAAKLQNRLVLNADIKDMGLDLFDGYAKTMDAVGRGKTNDLTRASASASDGIVEYKRNAANEFRKFYRGELMQKAREAAAKRPDSAELLKALDAEQEPTMLLGGDEITVSLAGVFDELGLVPEIVAKLTDPKIANARVAVTRTGIGDGTVEHDLAMQRGGGGQDILKKKVEPLARSLDTASKSLSGVPKQHADALVEQMNGMYTTEVEGENVLVDKRGDKVDFKTIEAQANQLIKKAGK